VLRHFKWDLEKFQTAWVDKSASLSKQIGIEFDQSVPKKFPFVNATLKQNNQGYCIICYGKFNTSDKIADSLSCGHEFCS